MKKFLLLICLLGLILTIPGLALAEEKEKEAEVLKLEEIVVTAARTEEELKVDVPVPESTYQVGATAVDVLETMSGIDTGRESLGTPNRSMVKIRGLDEARYIVNLDGRSLTGAGVYGGYYIDWSMLSLQDVEKIEVIKGAALAEYGNTLGGVINIVPKEPTEKLEFKFAAGAKEYETYDTQVLISKRTGPFGIVVGGGYRESDGYLRNNDLERKDASIYFSYYFPEEGKIKIGMRYNEGEYGMIVENKKDSPYYDDDYPESEGHRLIGPGFKWKTGKELGDSSYYWKERYEWDVVLEKDILGIDCEARYYLNDEDRTDHIYEQGSGDLAIKRDCPADYSWGWGFKGGKIVSNHALKAGVEGNYLGYGGVTYKYVDTTYLKGTFEDSDDQHEISKVNSAFIQDRWSLLSNLDIYLGLRADDYKADHKECEDVEDTPVSPKFGLFYSPISDFETFVTVARAVNFPTIPKYYWYHNGYQPPDRKGLTFEDAMQYEIGGTYKGIKDTSISAKVYHYDIDDYLRWIFGYKPSRVVYNIDNVELTGFELDIDSKIYDNIYAFANYTYQTTDKEGDILDKSNVSDEISELPNHKFNVGIKYQRDDGTLARLTLKWVDSREVPISASSKADTGKMDSYFLLNGIIKYPVIKNHGYVYAGCENILDEEYEETYGYPMPDRMFFGGIEIKF
ncbi:MAG: TonB-dependent receptor [Proteobacteria bacterium]|nr:TonB-dependent receptor [Pseudomonadota bacterium]